MACSLFLEEWTWAFAFSSCRAFAPDAGCGLEGDMVRLALLPGTLAPTFDPTLPPTVGFEEETAEEGVARLSLLIPEVRPERPAPLAFATGVALTTPLLQLLIDLARGLTAAVLGPAALALAGERVAIPSGTSSSLG